MYEQKWVVDALTAVIAVTSLFVALSSQCWVKPTRNMFIAFIIAAVFLSFIGNGWLGLGVAFLYIIILYRCGDKVEEEAMPLMTKPFRQSIPLVILPGEGSNSEPFTIRAKHPSKEYDMMGNYKPVGDEEARPMERGPMDEDALRRFITPETLDAAQGTYGDWPSPAGS